MASTLRVLNGRPEDLANFIPGRGIGQADIMMDLGDYDNMNKVLYWDHGGLGGAAPLFGEGDALETPETFAIGDDELGNIITVEPWKKGLILIKKTGVGICKVSIRGRQRTSTGWEDWWILKDDAGADAIISFAGGAQEGRAIVDTLGFHELSVRVYDVTGDSVDLLAKGSGSL